MSIGFSTKPYDLGIRTGFLQNFNASSFVPITELSRTDADVTVLLLNSHAAYTGKVVDPWFEATLPIGGHQLKEAWVSNLTLTGIGCTEQYQFCNFDQCTPLNGLYGSYPFMAPPDLDFSPIQQATHRLLGPNIAATPMVNYVGFLRDEILLANTLAYGSFLGISSPVPDTQWQTEMENIYNITMTGLQKNVVAHAASPNVQVRPGVDLNSFIIPETDPLGLRICASQKFRTSTHSSFSMFGLSFLVLVCALIILTNLWLPNFVHWIQRRSHNGLVPRLAWIEDDVLQLQRIALERRGIGPWKKKWDGVPVTAEFGKKFRRDTTFAEWGQLSEIFKSLTEPESGGERGELEALKSQMRVVPEP
ncbi:hypothetical protein H2201_008940 [Coniosporium apollinis]|uniref:Uncharacterized protein n=1 Tax=Coniosporium apollinis TaxID=61459 RepID=A0ABQ9NI51_9PEZI|nr:hypothetical protein H2201_008940 [Coniosporium apollinis]